MVAAALNAAVRSLTACEREQSLKLHSDVEHLKATFREKLEALEAEFVRQAEALSTELANAVAVSKHSCAMCVSARADELADAIVAAGEMGSDGMAELDPHGEWQARMQRVHDAPQPAPRGAPQAGVASYRTPAARAPPPDWSSDDDD